jgi:hypothetical protein
MARQHSQSRRHTDQVRNKIIDLTFKIHLKIKTSDKPILTSNFEDSTSIAEPPFTLNGHETVLSPITIPWLRCSTAAAASHKYGNADVIIICVALFSGVYSACTISHNKHLPMSPPGHGSLCLLYEPPQVSKSNSIRRRHHVHGAATAIFRHTSPHLPHRRHDICQRLHEYLRFLC